MVDDHDPYASLPTAPVLYPAPEPGDTEQADPGNIQIPFGYTEEQQLVTWNIGLRSPSPHLLAVGPSGAGLSTLLRTLAVGTTRRGVETWVIDPTGAVLTDLNTWPGVMRTAGTPTEASDLIDAAYARTYETYKRLHNREIRNDEVERLVVLVDLAKILLPQLRNEWTERGKGPARALTQLSELVGIARSAGVHFALTSSGAFLGENHVELQWSVRDNLRTRISLGQLSRSAAMVIWDNDTIGTTPNVEPGRGWATSAAGVPVPTQLLWTPSLDRDPLHRNALSSEERQRIDQLRPDSPTQ
jgi:hypothetical protein